jgi:methyltransferase
MTLLHGVLLAVVAQRLGELLYARRNEARLRAAGGTEHGAGHYPLFVLLHAAWLVALWAWVPAAAPADWWLLGGFGLAQLGRVWVLVSLGRWWTTRIITLSGAPLVRRGPYRFLRHPNYLIVVAEIALLPLAFGAWRIALVFSLLNALLLAWRIRIENRALAGRRNLVGSLSSAAGK